ncbi:MAG: TonB family protein [Thermodesulfobacteriota bacterium]|jgi:protein TonB
MKRFKNVGDPSRPLTDLPESDSGALFKTGILSLLFHIVLIIFLIFYLKTGITRSGSPIYRVTITSVSPQNNSNHYPLQELPTPQSAPAKTQKEEKRLKEELKRKEPIKEPKQPRQHQVDEETIKKPIPLPMAPTSSLVTDLNLEKEDKNTIPELSSIDGPRTGPGGSASGGSVEGQGTGKEGSRWGGPGEGTGRGSSGWASSGKEIGTGSGIPGLKGSGTGKKGPWGGSGDGRSGTSVPRYGENPKPVYPLEARQKGYEGEVLLKVEALQNGRVGEVQVEKSSGYEILDQSAIAAVKKWRFVPASKGGVNIPCWVNIPFKFQLRDISF